MQADFYALADHLKGRLHGDEVFLALYSGESSDFVRFNKNRIRQPGSVEQGFVMLRLISGNRQVRTSLPYTGDTPESRAQFDRVLGELRERLSLVPEDPYLLYNTEPVSSDRQGESRLPLAADAVDAIISQSGDKDLVGIYTQGSIERGFANSLGQRNWFSSHSFSLDWSYYLRADKAVKSSYGGFEWSDAAFGAKVEHASRQLAALDQPVRRIEPGAYRVFLTPAALNEFMGMMAWGGFGKRMHATRQTAFLKLVQGEVSLHPSVTIKENTAGGVDADFNQDGFIKPAEVVLIEGGKFKDCLVSPRSAREFDCQTNGADSGESPNSLDMAAGTLPADRAMSELGTGVWINNLWYLNFSDRNSFRITGMTRFATFWVEDGEISAPIEVMRFDETVYHTLGDKLIGLTEEREMLLSTDTYEERGTDSSRLPGALIEDFRFTL